MTNSVQRGKRERLTAAALRVFHEQGVEKTTIADIAHSAEVPVGNVYYYFKTKDHIVAAVLDEHAAGLRATIAALEQQHTPRQRLKELVRGWVEQRELTAQFGCPFGTLACELDKRADGHDRAAAAVMGLLIDWIREQFAAMGRADADDLAVALLAAYQGISLLTNTFRDPELMVAEGRRLERWIDVLGSD